MTWGGWVGPGLLVLALAAAEPAAAQGDGAEPARELARLMLNDQSRRSIDEQVTAGLVQSVAAALQERLSRRLLEVEWHTIVTIVRRFVADTLPSGRIDEIAAQAYARHFDEAELREMVQFQRSPVARKLMRLGPVIAADTAAAIDRDIRSSPAVPAMVEELRRAFPVLGAPESP